LQTFGDAIGGHRPPLQLTFRSFKTQITRFVLSFCFSSTFELNE
jgi:hypothetical protein